MNHKIRLSLTSFIALSVIGLMAIVFLHYQTRDRYRVVFDTDKNIGLEINKLHYSGSKAGRVTWEMDADRAVRTKGDGVVRLDTVKAVFYAKDGATYILTAREAAFDEAAGVIDASGNVIIRSKAGEIVETDSLRYMTKAREITTKDPVRFIAKGAHITGVGLLVEVDKGRVEILKDVNAVLNGATE